MSSEFDQYSQNGYNAGMDNQVKFILTGAMGKKTLQLGKLSHIFHLLNKDQPLTVYDFGCGDGEMLECLSSLFPQHEFNGSDISQGMIELAQKRFSDQNKSIHVQLAQIGSIPLPDNSQDIILTSCVFHHIPFEEHQLNMLEISRVLKPNGYFIMFEHNPFNPLTQLIVRTSPIDQNAKLLTATYAKKIYKVALFQNIKVKFFLFTPPHLKKLAWIDKVSSHLPLVRLLGGQYLIVGQKKIN